MMQTCSFLKLGFQKKFNVSRREGKMLIFIVCQESSWMLDFP